MYKGMRGSNNYFLTVLQCGSNFVQRDAVTRAACPSDIISEKSYKHKLGNIILTRNIPEKICDEF